MTTQVLQTVDSKLVPEVLPPEMAKSSHFETDQGARVARVAARLAV